MSPHTPRLLLVLLGLAALASGCASRTMYSVDAPEPATAAAPPPKSGYASSIRVESIVRGGGVKLNGFLVSDLPGYVEVETDESGKVSMQYIITLSTNVLDPDTARVTLEPGEAAPGRIYFDRSSILVADPAQVHKLQ